MTNGFSRYQIRDKIGSGGMGTVYRAYDQEIQRDVALKWLPESFSHNPAFTERFKREARMIARLEHPHIVPIYDVGESDERPFIIMRLLTGGTLADRLRDPAFGLSGFLRTLDQIVDALTRAHAENIIHRDIKPANILFDERGSAFLSDFGIAKMLDATVQLTGAGMIGTPAYMSPEQFSGANVNASSDQYSLAIVVFEAITGNLPFEGNTVEVMFKHLYAPPPQVHLLPQGIGNGHESHLINAVLSRALSKNQADRYPTISDFVEALRQVAISDLPLYQPLPVARTLLPGAATALQSSSVRPASQVGSQPSEETPPPELPLPTAARHQPVPVVQTGLDITQIEPAKEGAELPQASIVAPASVASPSWSRYAPFAIAGLLLVLLLVFGLPRLLGTGAEPPPATTASANVSFGGETSEAPTLTTNTAEPTATSTPKATPTAVGLTLNSQTTPTPEPTETETAVDPTATAATDHPIVEVIVASANLRTGPGSVYPIAGLAQQGDLLPVLATNRDKTWYLIERSDQTTAWLAVSVTRATAGADFASVSVAATIPAAPTVTATPVPIIVVVPTVNNGGGDNGGDNGGGDNGGGDGGGGVDATYTPEPP